MAVPKTGTYLVPTRVQATRLGSRFIFEALRFLSHCCKGGHAGCVLGARRPNRGKVLGRTVLVVMTWPRKWGCLAEVLRLETGTEFAVVNTDFSQLRRVGLLSRHCEHRWRQMLIKHECANLF